MDTPGGINIKQEDSGGRRNELDWLRTLAVLLLVYWHSALIFYPFPYFVKSDQTSFVLTVFVFFVHQWHMPLFFLISGAATWYSLGRRTAAGYGFDRVKRLLVPFVFGTLVLVPPLIYHELLFKEYKGGLGSIVPGFQFYINSVKGFPINRHYDPEGYYTWAHFWFLAYLFTFSFAALPLFNYLKGEGGKRLVSKFSAFCQRRGGILVLGVLPALIEAVLRGKWSGQDKNLYNDWAQFALYFCYFCYGYLIYSSGPLKSAFKRDYKISLVFAVVFYLIFSALAISGHLPKTPGGYSMKMVIYRTLLSGFHGWFWIAGILGLGMNFLQSRSRFLDYANEAAYPAYIIHHTVVVIVGYHVIRSGLGGGGEAGRLAQYFFIGTSSLVLTAALYEVLVRRIFFMRFILGMRPRKKPGP